MLHDKPLISLVLLLSAPRALEAEVVRAKIGRALEIVFPDGPDATSFVLPMPDELPRQAFGSPGKSFMVKVPQGIFQLNSITSPYVELSKQAKNRADMRLQHVLQDQRAWLSFDLLQSFDRVTEADTYRCIGKVLAAFLADDCLGVYCPDLKRCREIGEDIAERLAGRDPLSIFAANTPAPPVIANDDSRIQAAIAEAQFGWPDFAAACNHPISAQHGFSVKAPFTEGENTEYLWVRISRLTTFTATGTLDKAPCNLRRLKQHDTVTVPVAEIVDWLYFDGDGLDMVGGFTLKVEREVGGK